MLIEWFPIETAPKDGTLALLYCPKEIERESYTRYPKLAEHVTIGFFGERGPDWAPRGPAWLSVEVVGEMFQGSERTGSWMVYEFIELEPTKWFPIPGID